MLLEFGSSSATISGDLDDERHRRIVARKRQRRQSSVHPPQQRVVDTVDTAPTVTVIRRCLAYWNLLSCFLFLLSACGVTYAEMVTSSGVSVARTTKSTNRTTGVSEGGCASDAAAEFRRRISSGGGGNRTNASLRDDKGQCKPFDDEAIDKICSIQGSSRFSELRYYYLFADSPELSAGQLNLFNFFNLQIKNNHADFSDPSTRNNLDSSLDDCFSRDASVDDCRNCYRNLSMRIRKVLERYDLFSKMVLSKLDCEPGDDFLHSYSAIFGCSHCKVWYTKWLLVTMKGVWTQGPCIEWCHLAELACPHLQASRKDDYAGLPSFRCTDATIPNSTYRSGGAAKSDCLHPCDQWGLMVIDAKNGVGGEQFKLFCNKSRPRPNRKLYMKKKRKHFDAAVSSSSSSSFSSSSIAPPHKKLIIKIIIMMITFFLTLLRRS